MDAADFAEYLGPDENGNPVTTQKFQREWHRHLDLHSRAVIEAPIKHGKTEQIAIRRVIWELGRNRNLRIKLLCADDEEAEKRVMAVADHIKNNPRVRQVFPHLKPAQQGRWTQKQIFVERDVIGMKDPSFEGKGVLASESGATCDLLVFDDPVTYRNSVANPKMITAVNRAFFHVWLNRLIPSGRLAGICTPWVQEDLIHQLKKRPAYKFLSQPISADLQPIWPDVWPTEVLAERLREIGNVAFARAFRLLTMTLEAALFKSANQFFENRTELQHVPEVWNRYSGIDLAISEDPQASRTAIHTMAVAPDGKRIPLEVTVGHFSSLESAKEIVRHYDRYRPQVMLVENNGMQEAIRQWTLEYARGLNRSLAIPLMPFLTGKNKSDPNVGLPSIAAELDNSYWDFRLAGHPDECNCGLCETVRELLGWPSAGHRRDTVMAMWFAREAARLYGGGGKATLVEKERKVQTDKKGFHDALKRIG